MSTFRILVVDDEEDLCDILQYNLEKDGYIVDIAYSAEDALKKDLTQYNLFLLDVMMGAMSGFKLGSMLKKDETTSHIPIIFITAKDTETDTLTGFTIGADDYITKPFSVRELMARIKAVLRRSASEAEESTVYSFSDVVIDYDKHQVKKNNQKVELTLKEYELLDILVKNRGKVMKRDVLLDKIWGYEYVGETRTVDVHIRHLRQKLEDDDKNPIYIETVRGIGYRFNDLES